MVNISREMQRQGFTIPLLIGGATTSPTHTSVKIAPHYKSPVVYVKDASRAVGVCQALITQTQREAFITHNDAEHERRREQHAAKKVKAPELTITAARANRRRIDWTKPAPSVPLAPAVEQSCFLH
jgi:5-methyltetrahydrofolate--homocysteine methyltransferase